LVIQKGLPQANTFSMDSTDQISDPNRIAIACSTGGFKGVFIHGVLSAFESKDFRVAAYGAASSSVLPAAAAAAGIVSRLGVDFWDGGRRIIAQSGKGMSEMVLAGISQVSPWLRPQLFHDTSSRMLIAANAVDEAGGLETQGKGGRRRGRHLLLDAARGRRDWIEKHLSLHLFDTASEDEYTKLTVSNFDEVAYASSRMLHAWDVPAWVNGLPYVDAFYTCACPALELADLGYDLVIALSSEPVLYLDIFQAEQMPDKWGDVDIWTICPKWDPSRFGVDYTNASAKGLQQLFNHGYEKGRAFLTQKVAT
jgi:hypothetical protein